MINKKNVLGKNAYELGVKDAIHTAIVSVRAGCTISPGEKCGLNQYNEAIPLGKNAIGVADPFLTSKISTGEYFWLLLNQDEVPNVKHVWEHPSVDFSPPTREVELNKEIMHYANEFGITYQELMKACEDCVNTGKPVPYKGTKSLDEVQEIIYEVGLYDLWNEWAVEVDYEFPNHGTYCCPEYSYPEDLFI